MYSDGRPRKAFRYRCGQAPANIMMYLAFYYFVLFYCRHYVEMYVHCYQYTLL